MLSGIPGVLTQQTKADALSKMKSSVEDQREASGSAWHQHLLTLQEEVETSPQLVCP